MRPMTFVKPAFSISRREIHPCGATAPVRGELSYADELRALGQALEPQGLVSIDLQAKGGDYLVRGWAHSLQERSPDVLDRLEEMVVSALRGKSATPMQISEWVYEFPPERIQQLHREGRKKRVEGNQTPDPCRLSQILRSAGCYIDSKLEICLSGISIKDRWVTVSYVTAAGRVEQTKAALDFYYDYWIKMYLRRRVTADTASPDGRSPLVARH